MRLIVVLNIFYAVCFLPILLVVYIVTRNEGKPKNNLILSTTLPKEAWEDERVLAIKKQFYRRLDITCVILFLLFFPVLLTTYISIQMTYLCVWLMMILILPYIPYCSAVKKLRALKKEHWYHPELVKVQVTDTSLATVFEEKQNTYTFVNFLLPLLVSMVPMLYPLVVPTEGSLFTLYLITLLNTGTILLLYFCYRFMLRRKSDRVNADVTLTTVLTRIRKYYWGKFWLYSAWCCAVFNFSTLLIYLSDIAYMIIMLIFITAVIGLALWAELKIRTEQQRLNKEQPSEILVDEDDYWPYGIVYYNKNDSSLLVNNRVGFGSTFNAAHPVGKALAVLTVILILTLPFWGIWMMEDEFTPPQVVLTEHAVEAWHTDKEYSIPLADILSCELLTELPERVTKNGGTNMPHLFKGSFSVKGIDNYCRLCLDPYDDLFLVIETDQKHYIFSMEESEELHTIYEALKEGGY